jgi:hypothetical protein
MKWALRIVLSLVAIAGAIALVGYFLRSLMKHPRVASFSRPPEDVFALLADPNGYKGWWGRRGCEDRSR